MSYKSEEDRYVAPLCKVIQLLPRKTFLQGSPPDRSYSTRDLDDYESI